jgi:hypothetical protein
MKCLYLVDISFFQNAHLYLLSFSFFHDIQQIPTGYHGIFFKKKKSMVVLQSIKPLGADFMGIGPMLGSPLQGPYSRKAHPEGFTLHKNVCRDPQYEV